MTKLLFVALLAIPLSLFPTVKADYLCGIASGFPPYQFTDDNGKPTGLDYEVAVLVFKSTGINVEFIQTNWDDILFSLAHKTGKIDMLCGTEITAERLKIFDFTIPYNKRYAAIFTLKNSEIIGISDLYGKKVAGDRHSAFEKYLSDVGNKSKIRIIHTVSKEVSFLKLKEGSVTAVIAPIEVGYYICKNMGIEVRILEERHEGADVGLAIGKGDKKLIPLLNAALQQLIDDGEIEEILDRYK